MTSAFAVAYCPWYCQAERRAQVSKITLEKEVNEKRAFQRIQAIEGERYRFARFVIR